jgi:hypothetical protein
MLGHLLHNRETQKETKYSLKNFASRYDLENLQIMAHANIKTYFIARSFNPCNIMGHKDIGHTTHKQFYLVILHDR